MKLINALRIFVAILFLILPIEILGEKVPKYTKMNHVKRKLEENDNYIIVKYGTETTYGADKFKNEYRQSVDHIKYNGEKVDLTKDFTIKANTTIEIYFSETTITSLNSFFATYDSADPNAINITYINLSHFDSSSVTDTNYMFFKCSSLEEINFNNFNTSKVTGMERMFMECSNLKSLDLSNFNTSNVKNMQGMFLNAKKIKYIDLSHLDSSSVDDTSQMFAGCSSLEEINFNNFNTSKVTDMQEMFYECSNLKSLDLSNFDTSNVEKIYSMFS